jgi:hypothetical protein
MELTKKNLIDIFQKTPFDPMDSIFVVGHGKKPDNNGGTLCALLGNTKDVIYALCMAYKESPQLYKVIVASLEAFGEVMIETIKNYSNEEGEKITPIAEA